LLNTPRLPHYTTVFLANIKKTDVAAVQKHIVYSKGTAIDAENK